MQPKLEWKPRGTLEEWHASTGRLYIRLDGTGYHAWFRTMFGEIMLSCGSHDCADICDAMSWAEAQVASEMEKICGQLTPSKPSSRGE
jgi:hypothetical protein